MSATIYEGASISPPRDSATQQHKRENYPPPTPCVDYGISFLVIASFSVAWIYYGSLIFRR
jgi:hypothetical protein